MWLPVFQHQGQRRTRPLLAGGGGRMEWIHLHLWHIQSLVTETRPTVRNNRRASRNRGRNQQIMMWWFMFFLLFLSCSSVIATDSESAGEWGRKGKKKNKTTSSYYFVFSSTNCFMHWRCKKMFFKIPRRSVLLTPFLLGRLWMLNTSRLTHSSASSNWGTISLWPCPNQ